MKLILINKNIASGVGFPFIDGAYRIQHSEITHRFFFGGKLRKIYLTF